MKEVFGDPRHPYTRALLDSVPVNGVLGAKLKSIPGSPPELHKVPNGCVYQDRCPLVQEICLRQRPALESVSDGHAAACHFAKEPISA